MTGSPRWTFWSQLAEIGGCGESSDGLRREHDVAGHAIVQAEAYAQARVKEERPVGY